MRSVEEDPGASRRSISESSWRSRMMMVQEGARRRRTKIISQIKTGPPERQRGKRKAEDEREHEEAKRLDGIIVSCLREEVLTRRESHEAVRAGAGRSLRRH